MPVYDIIVFERTSSCWSRPATVLEWRTRVVSRRQYIRRRGPIVCAVQVYYPSTSFRLSC